MSVISDPGERSCPPTLSKRREKTWGTRLAGVVDNLDPKLDDDDVVRVRKLFEVISKVTTEQEHKLQTIVLDHAADNVWWDIPGIHLVEEWRGPDKLIPQSWME